MKHLQLIRSYKDGVPIFLIARLYNLSVHKVISILHTKIIAEAKEILDEIDKPNTSKRSGC